MKHGGQSGEGSQFTVYDPGLLATGVCLMWVMMLPLRRKRREPSSLILTINPGLLAQLSYAHYLTWKRTSPRFTLWLPVPYYIRIRLLLLGKMEFNLEEFVSYLNGRDWYSLCLYLRTPNHVVSVALIYYFGLVGG